MGMMHKNSPSSGLGAVAAAAESAVYTTPALTIGQGDGAVGVSGTVNITAGTGTTAVNVKCRQGSGTGGTLLAPAAGYTHTLAAGATASVSYGFTDNSQYLEGGGQYTVTVTQTAGTAGGTANVLDIEVLV